MAWCKFDLLSQWHQSLVEIWRQDTHGSQFEDWRYGWETLAEWRYCTLQSTAVFAQNVHHGAPCPSNAMEVYSTHLSSLSIHQSSDIHGQISQHYRWVIWPVIDELSCDLFHLWAYMINCRVFIALITLVWQAILEEPMPCIADVAEVQKGWKFYVKLQCKQAKSDRRAIKNFRPLLYLGTEMLWHCYAGRCGSMSVSVVPTMLTLMVTRWICMFLKQKKLGQKLCISWVSWTIYVPPKTAKSSLQPPRYLPHPNVLHPSKLLMLGFALDLTQGWVVFSIVNLFRWYLVSPCTSSKARLWSSDSCLPVCHQKQDCKVLTDWMAWSYKVEYKQILHYWKHLLN